jgi:glucose/arabinose dehydrogenase
MKRSIIIALALMLCSAGFAQGANNQKTDEAKADDKKTDSKPASQPNRKIPANAKVYLAPMSGFEQDLKTAIEKKKVPVVLVAERDKADYEITGTSDTEKASTAKKVIMWNWHSNEQASITVNEIKSGEVVFAYSVNKQSSAHGKRSTAEACAKHLKEQIEGK